MTTDQNLKDTFKVYTDDDGVINLEMLQGVSDVTANVHQAELLKSELQKSLDRHPNQNFDCLVNLLALGNQAHYPSPEARRIFAQMFDNKQINKIAVLISGSLLASIIRFIVSISNKKEKVEFFETPQQAKKWLKG
jgi:hypothetical protein